MHTSLVPSPSDLAGLLAYILGNPYLFISSSTLMTTGLVLGAVAVSMVPRSAPVMRVVAPPLAMLLVYFGVGSMILATEILVRFHDSIPDATETQFASGIGHLLEAAAAIAVLSPHLRARSRVAWIVANIVAAGHWGAQGIPLTPPRFALPGQLPGIRAPALGALAAGARGTEEAAHDRGYRWIVGHHQDAAQLAPSSGRTTWNVLPVPSRLSTQIRPPCCSTMPLQRKRPSPIPEKRRSSTFEARWNRSKICGGPPAGGAPPPRADQQEPFPVPGAAPPWRPAPLRRVRS